MAKPRVFISSTHKDLITLRESVETVVKAMGYDPVMSENGGITYRHDIGVEESCYVEVRNSQFFVLIIGRRYGSAAGGTQTGTPKSFYEVYNSVTRGEYLAAVERQIRTYVLVERSIYTEYELYRNNEANHDIVYPYAESVNVFMLIKEIEDSTNKPPLYKFDKAQEIGDWLRDQWAGLIVDFLQRSSLPGSFGNGTPATPASPVSQPGPISATLLERPTGRALVDRRLRKNPLTRFLMTDCGLSFETVRYGAETAASLHGFVAKLRADQAVDASTLSKIDILVKTSARRRALKDLNKMRTDLGLTAVSA